MAYIIDVTNLINNREIEEIIESNEFFFDEGEGIVNIVPMKNLFCKRVMDRFYKECAPHVHPFCCYSNALIAADFFNNNGFQVDVIEGIYRPNPLLSEKEKNSFFTEIRGDMHRFCKKGNYYFDPSLECVIGFSAAHKYFQHISLREYDSVTLWAYGVALGNGETPKFCSSINGFSCDSEGEERHDDYINRFFHLTPSNVNDSVKSYMR